MLNIMLELLFLISTFTLNMGQDPKNQIVQFLTIFNLHSVLEIGKILVLELMSPAFRVGNVLIFEKNDRFVKKTSRKIRKRNDRF